MLDRAEAAAVTLSAERDLTIASRGGAVRIVAAQEILAAAGKALRAVAPEVELEAGVANVAIRALDYAGETVKTAAKFIETRAERVSEHVERCIRFVSELDMLRAKQVDHHAEDTMHLRARHALVTANQVVKIDGEQVQLG